MTMGLLASWTKIQEGTIAFFQSFRGWGIAEVLLEIFMIFFLLFFVSKATAHRYRGKTSRQCDEIF